MTHLPGDRADLRALLLDYLDFYREIIVAKTTGLGAAELSTSVVPSGWTPAGLLNHLVHMEQRWFVWGFLGEHVDAPWGDSARLEPGWREAGLPLDDVVGRLRAGGRRTREIVEAHALDDIAAVGGRFESAADAPRLQWILLHVLQEYARHAGHLDIARELTDGLTGEDG